MKQVQNQRVASPLTLPDKAPVGLNISASPVDIVGTPSTKPTNALFRDMADALSIITNPQGGYAKLADAKQKEFSDYETEKGVADALQSTINGDFSRPAVSTQQSPQYELARMQIWGKSMANKLASEYVSQAFEPLLKDPDKLVSADLNKVGEDWLAQNKIDHLSRDPALASLVGPALLDARSKAIGQLQVAQEKERQARAATQYRDTVFGNINPANSIAPNLDIKGMLDAGAQAQIPEADRLGNIVDAITTRFNAGDRSIWGLINQPIEQPDGNKLSLVQMIGRTGDRGLLANLNYMQDTIQKQNMETIKAEQEQADAVLEVSFYKRIKNGEDVSAEEIMQSGMSSYAKKVSLIKEMLGRTDETIASTRVADAIDNGSSMYLPPQEVSKVLNEQVSQLMQQSNGDITKLGNIIVGYVKRGVPGIDKIDFIKNLADSAFITNPTEKGKDGDKPSYQMSQLLALSKSIYAGTGGNKGEAYATLKLFMPTDKADMLINYLASSDASSNDTGFVKYYAELTAKKAGLDPSAKLTPAERKSFKGDLQRGAIVRILGMKGSMSENTSEEILQDFEDYYNTEYYSKGIPTSKETVFNVFKNTLDDRYVKTDIDGYGTDHWIKYPPVSPEDKKHFQEGITAEIQRIRKVLDNNSKTKDTQFSVRGVRDQPGEYRVDFFIGDNPYTHYISASKVIELNKQWRRDTLELHKRATKDKSWAGQAATTAVNFVTGAFTTPDNYGGSESQALASLIAERQQLNTTYNKALASTKVSNSITLPAALPPPMEPKAGKGSYNRSIQEIDNTRVLATNNPTLAIATVLHGDIPALGLNNANSTEAELTRYLRDAGVTTPAEVKAILGGTMKPTQQQSQLMYESAIRTKYRPMLDKAFEARGIPLSSVPFSQWQMAAMTSALHVDPKAAGQFVDIVLSTDPTKWDNFKLTDSTGKRNKDVENAIKSSFIGLQGFLNYALIK